MLPLPSSRTCGVSGSLHALARGQGRPAIPALARPIEGTLFRIAQQVAHLRQRNRDVWQQLIGAAATQAIDDVFEVETLCFEAALQSPPMHTELRSDTVDAAARYGELALDQCLDLLADVERKAPDQIADIALGRRLQFLAARVNGNCQQPRRKDHLVGALGEADCTAEELPVTRRAQHSAVH